MLEASPGEPLPEFPKPTHCDPDLLDQHPDRRPWLTVNRAIAGIPRTTSMHNPPPISRNPTFVIGATGDWLSKYLPYNGNQPMTSTITCAAGQSYHPSGQRDFTLREIACLQGFPLEHEFADHGKGKIRKQIGNAVPPIVAKVFFEQIVRALKNADGV